MLTGSLPTQARRKTTLITVGPQKLSHDTLSDKERSRCSQSNYSNFAYGKLQIGAANLPLAIRTAGCDSWELGLSKNQEVLVPDPVSFS